MTKFSNVIHITIEETRRTTCGFETNQNFNPIHAMLAKFATLCMFEMLRTIVTYSLMLADSQVHPTQYQNFQTHSISCHFQL